MRAETVSFTVILFLFLSSDALAICDYGWIGESCTESAFCVIIETTETNFNPRLPREEDIFGAKKRTTCLSTCNTSLAVDVADYEGNRYHFVPIESECNMNQLFVKIIGSSGIVLSAGIIVCIVLVIRRRNRKLSTSKANDEEANIECNDVCNHQRPTNCEHDYVNDHLRLAEVVKDPEYENVGDFRRLFGEPIKQECEYDYVYDHRQNLSATHQT